MHPYWFGVVVEKLPDEIENGIVLSQPFSDSSAAEDFYPDESVGQLDFAILVRTLAEDARTGARQVKDAVEELSPSDMVMLADQPASLVRSERRLASWLLPGDVAIKDSFVGVKRDCAESRKSAIEIIRKAIHRKAWQFWR